MKLQAPRGTRDFYPQDMAWQNYLRDAWRRVSIRHGFEEIDGPIFETLELYTIKSGPGIVSELFSFRRAKGDTDFALRPEFTPTLARMVAARANALPKPIKWFCTPNLCRAERPQRGRLREFLQWNIDLLGLDSATADAEVILVAVDLLQELGLSSDQVRIKISHRNVVRKILGRLGVNNDKMNDAFNLLDRRDKFPKEVFTQQAMALGLDEYRVDRFEQMCRRKYQAGDVSHMQRSVGLEQPLDDLEALDQQLQNFGVADWCEYDLGIVRGLAYYTGTVFEVHEATGVERAMAGGGRYDNLIELFGGPVLPAIGFGMGDVVLTNVLRDKNLIPDDVCPSPDAFIFAVTDSGAAQLGRVVGDLRTRGVHARFSYKTTRNTGKLLKDADSCHARLAVILDDQVANGQATVKNMKTGEQTQLAISQLAKCCAAR
jgi:histidyl-tRNA synthetase